MLSLVHTNCPLQVSKGCSGCHSYFGTQEGFVSIHTPTITTEEGRKWIELHAGGRFRSKCHLCPHFIGQSETHGYYQLLQAAGQRIHTCSESREPELFCEQSLPWAKVVSTREFWRNDGCFLIEVNSRCQ